MLLWLQYLKQLEVACASAAKLEPSAAPNVKSMCEDEEWGNENETMPGEPRTPSSAGDRPASSEGASPNSADSPTPAAESPPRLRLNASLAMDPALAPHASLLKREAPSPSPPPPAPLVPPMPAPTARDYLALTTAFPNLFPTTGGPAYVCAPCGIRYSSISTLQAHQDHYCTHRLSKPSFDTQGDTQSADVAVDESSEGSAKTPRPGKQYACTYCSYSADKKVSLNRHMRMHATSPSPPTQSTPTPHSNGDVAETPPPQDRYCTDCDIRFSSIKTYRAHKTHYCSTRQVLKQAQSQARGGSSCTSGSAPPSPGTTPPSPAQQLVLALPTNPILIVPYSLLRGASTLPGATLPDPEAPCFLLPNGTIQPMSRALAAVTGEAKEPEVLKSANRPREPSRDATVPLDLSVRRSPEPGTTPRPDSDEHEKENRMRTATPEQIVCAPSLPASPATPSPSPRRSSSPTSESSPKRRKRDSRGPTPKPPSIPSPPDQKFNTQIAPPMLPPALALRLSSDLSLAAASPQVLVKQGVSKCKECNIVFCKYENYRIHKQHYCSSGTGEERASPAPPEPGPPPQYRQLICLACGIKFSSLDNLATHQSYYCLKRETRSPRSSVGEMVRSGSSNSEGGWKCLCCDVVSPTAAAAQRHMEVHAGVKAFRCTICRYRGNTLRGMRTHIRMHFPKKPADLQEESYIACVVEDDSREAVSPGGVGGSGAVAGGAGGGGAGGERVHRCSSCAYTSTYRGNVVRHARLVHAIDEPEREESPPRPPPSPSPRIKTEPEPEPDVETEEEQPNYCKSCDISFKYVNTFKAHKKFYCPIQEASANNNLPVPPATRVTDTPVL